MKMKKIRSGFTLIELVVTLAIIAILMAIILPAVFASRNSAARVHCGSNLKQLGVGIAQYQDIHGVFPDGVMYRYALLPHIEQSSVYQRRNGAGTTEDEIWGGIRDAQVPVYRCPAESAPLVVSSFGNRAGTASASYGGCWGTWLFKTGFDGVFVPFLDNFFPNTYPASPVRPASIKRGLSNTAAMSEIICSDGSAARMRAVWLLPVTFSNPSDLDAFTQTCESIPLEPAAFGYTGLQLLKGRPWYNGYVGNGAYNHAGGPNRPSCLNGGANLSGVYSAASSHGGLVNVLYADGHVQVVNEQISIAVWRMMGSRSSDAAGL